MTWSMTTPMTTPSSGARVRRGLSSGRPPCRPSLPRLATAGRAELERPDRDPHALQPAVGDRHTDVAPPRVEQIPPVRGRLEPDAKDPARSHRPVGRVRDGLSNPVTRVATQVAGPLEETRPRRAARVVVELLAVQDRLDLERGRVRKTTVRADRWPHPGPVAGVGQQAGERSL